jgi:hypothetical protein
MKQKAQLLTLKHRFLGLPKYVLIVELNRTKEEG